MRSTDFIRNAAGLVFHICFPVTCPVCKKIATAGCIGCFLDQVVPLLPRCSICAGPYPCSRHRKSFPVISGNLHEKIPRELVLELKYNKNERIGRLMGQALCRKMNIPECDILVPVPLHKGSRRKYNQALSISKGIAEIMDNRTAEILEWNYRAECQSSKNGKSEKKSMPSGAIRANRSGEGARTVLVDDVVTTGTTLSRCSEALENKGFRVVGAVTWTASAYS